MSKPERELDFDELDGVCGGVGTIIEAVSFSALSAAANSANEDLMTIMDGVKLINSQKDALRPSMNVIGKVPH